MEILKKIIQKVAWAVLCLGFFLAMAAVGMMQTFAASSVSTEGSNFLTWVAFIVLVVCMIAILAYDIAKPQNEDGELEKKKSDKEVDEACNSLPGRIGTFFSYAAFFQIYMLCFHIIQYIGFTKLPTVFQPVNRELFLNDIVVFGVAVLVSFILCTIAIRGVSKNDSSKNFPPSNPTASA